MSAGRSGVSGKAWALWGWATVFVMLFGATLAMQFSMYLAASAGDAGHAIVKALPVLAQHIKGDVQSKP